MSVRIRHFDSREAAHRRHTSIPLVTAISQTRLTFGLFKPGTKFIIHGMNVYCATKAGAVTVDALLVNDNDIIEAGALAIDSVPEDFQLAASRYMVDGVVVVKAAATGVSFTAAHTINTGAAVGSFWGAILIQIDTAGALSTKVVSADQVYTSEAAALAALPAADASKLAIGYIMINANDDAAWTGNTDDMTDASDVATATFNAYAATGLSGLAAVATPSAGKNVAAAAHATLDRTRSKTGDHSILLEYTSDGSGALTHALVDVIWRPIPMARDKTVR